MEDSIQAVEKISAKTNFTNSSKKAVNSSKNFEQIHSTNFLETNQFDCKSSCLERIANSFINII